MKFSRFKHVFLATIMLLFGVALLSGCGSSDSSSGVGTTNYCPNRDNPIVFTPEWSDGYKKLTISLELPKINIKSYAGNAVNFAIDDGVGVNMFPYGGGSLNAQFSPTTLADGYTDSIVCEVLDTGGADYDGGVKCTIKNVGLIEYSTVNLSTDRSYQKLRIYANSTEPSSGPAGAACGYYSIGINQSEKKFVTSPMPYTPETHGLWWE
ncbi:hypothetical protein FACS1894103_0710 [Campylobacterota bacterium]|nr:hypothetical protein FACS1894103_0400 [Campylobacterota bacterium]GHV58726.1 hypothetical protein FACS1894103_0710 [Campylobacterota bacterium]